MQSENDDIEGLFRRASEDYPLNTGSSNWEKIADLLDKEKPAAKPFFSWKKLVGPALLGVIFLGAATIGVNYFYGHENKIKAHQFNNTIAKNDSKQDNGSMNNLVPATQNTSLSSPTFTHASQKENKIINDKKLFSRNSRSAGNNSIILFGKSSPSYFKKSTRLNATKNNLTSNVSSPEIDGLVANSNSGSSNTKSDIDQSEKKSSNIEEPKIITQSLDSSNNQAQKTPDKNVKLNKAAANKKLKTAHQYFYITALLGPDISNIKQQSYDQAGLSVGALVGFSTNKWLMETGMVWDKKYYYTTGKYFNPKTTSAYKTIDLSGNCNMYEIPVNLGYKLISSRQSNLIIKSGVSSYLMKKEFYNYNYYNSYYQRASGSATYKNSTNNWFSVMNFSLNYNYKINRSASIGIEPYFKVPLQGLGYGRLPISSSGLYVVLSKKLF